MIYLYRYFSDEAIENVITCMNRNIDRVIFFGEHDAILKGKKTTKKFLEKYCDVNLTMFREITTDNLNELIMTVQMFLRHEIDEGNDVYFDITGGEGIFPLALGILANQYNIPMHICNVKANELIALNEGRNIKDHVSIRETKLNLKMLIELYGGAINISSRQEKKNPNNSQVTDAAEKLWNVAKKHWELWSPFSSFLRSNMSLDTLCFEQEATAVVMQLLNAQNELDKPMELNAIFDDLEAEGLVTNLVHTNKKYACKFKNVIIRDLIFESGSILELYTYQYEKENMDDCYVGVHLDWDGIFQNSTSNDVQNEIDVLALRGNIPVFISCKAGKMNPRNALFALYELQTVATRFGGKYAEKVLVITQEMPHASLLRAEEMGIEVRLIE